MAEQAFICPLCGGAMRVTPARWQVCQHCHGSVLVPSLLRSPPAGHGRCAICGDLVRLHDDDDDAVCPPCFEANLRGDPSVRRQTVAPLADAWPVRRRELATRDSARWPLTHGQTQEG